MSKAEDRMIEAGPEARELARAAGMTGRLADPDLVIVRDMTLEEIRAEAGEIWDDLRARFPGLLAE